ncbi:MAG: hypothetical protein O3C40_11145 [Planctomycetota bacterium]|nr:hypothetical protein [Planctomycetota bacterium]
MRVAIHRQLDGRMAGECLSGLRMHAGGCQLAYVLMAERVKVEDAAGGVFVLERIGLFAGSPFVIVRGVVDPSRAGGFQVPAQHHGGDEIPRAGPELAGSLVTVQPGPQLGGDVGTDGLDVQPAALAVGGLDGQCWRVAIQVDRFGRQRFQLARSQPGIRSRQIQGGSVQSHQAAKRLLALAGRVDQPGELPRWQCSPFSAVFNVRIQRGEILARVLIRASIVNHPRGEGFEVSQIVVAGLDTKRIRGPLIGKPALQRRSFDVLPSRELATVDDLPNAAASLLDVVVTVVLVGQVPREVVNMLADRPHVMSGVGIFGKITNFDPNSKHVVGR